jgi:integrase
MGDSFKVKVWAIEQRPRRSPRVRWTVDGEPFNESFATVALADAFRSQLVTAARKGEAFDSETGLPRSLLRKRLDVSFLDHAREFAAREWKTSAATSRASMLDMLIRVVPAVTGDAPGRPDAAVLRRALSKHLNQGGKADPLSAAEARALAWLEKASRPVSALEDGAVVCDVLDALAVNLDGQAAAPGYFSRMRRSLHKVLGYAVRKKRLEKNPVSKGNLPEGWTPPAAPDGVVDPRCVGSPALIALMLAACARATPRQGPRMAAFFACMYYAMMRPAEVSALTMAGCHLPETGWGYLSFADSTPAAGRAFTDDGRVHEDRGLKGRNKGRPDTHSRARRTSRRVPVPPELVAILRDHVTRFGTGKDGRLFRSESGRPLPRSTISRAWKLARALSLSADQLATPLLARPYDLRHSGITWRLNSGVPATQVAEWAGNSVDVLMRVYARCMTGLDDVWIARMNEALHLEDGRPGSVPGPGRGSGPGGRTPGPQEGRADHPDDSQEGSDPDDTQL